MDYALRLGCSTNAHTITVAMLMRSESGVRTCSLQINVFSDYKVDLPARSRMYLMSAR